MGTGAGVSASRERVGTPAGVGDERMIFICESCLSKAGKHATWIRALRTCTRKKMRMWSGKCDVCAVVSLGVYQEVCRNLNPAEDDPDALCSHPGHPDHYGDR